MPKLPPPSPSTPSSNPSPAAMGTISTKLLAVSAGTALLLGAAGVTRAFTGQPETPAKEKPAPAKPRSNSNQPKTADIGTAQTAAFDITTTANGDLQAKTQLELRSQLEQQTTIQFIIPEGTRVKSGELLVQLNSDTIQNELDRETPNLASAKARAVAAENAYQIQINDNASALRKSHLDLELKQLGVRQWREGDVVKKRQDLDLRINKTDLELERLADKLRRSSELLKEGFISKDEADRDESSYIDAVSNYTNARLDRDVYEHYEFTREEKQKLSEVDESRNEVERVRLNNEIQLASKEADRANNKEQVKLLEARLEKLGKHLASCKVTAPRDGLVVYATSVDSNRWGGGESPLQIGQQVYPNMLIIVLPDTSEMIASVRVHEAVAGRVQPGQKASVKVDAMNGRVFEGTIESIGVMAESGGWRDPNTREYQVKIALNTEGAANLKPAMRVEARIVLDHAAETLTIPVQALFADGQVAFVYQPRGSRYVKTPVRVGKRSETTAQVFAGLSDGASVLLRQPQPGEILGEPWNQESLKVAGYETKEDGSIVPVGRPSGGPGQPRRSAGAPGEDQGKPTHDEPGDNATPDANDKKAPGTKVAAESTSETPVEAKKEEAAPKPGG